MSDFFDSDELKVERLEAEIERLAFRLGNAQRAHKYAEEEAERLRAALSDLWSNVSKQHWEPEFYDRMASLTEWRGEGETREERAAAAIADGRQDIAHEIRFDGTNEAEVIRRQAAEIERLRAALVKYGTHTSGCSNSRNVGECSCGLWEALRGEKL